jgi:hypothetical protein
MPPLTKRSHGIVELLGGLLVALALLAGVAPVAAQSAERCFPETGICIGGRIRVYWEQNGGLPVFGFPISAQP